MNELGKALLFPRRCRRFGENISLRYSPLFAMICLTLGLVTSDLATGGPALHYLTAHVGAGPVEPDASVPSQTLASEPGVIGVDNAQWSAYGGTVDSAQYSSLDQITPENVTQLEKVWSVPITGPGGDASPLIAGDRMYITGSGKLLCVDAATGKEIWRSAVDPGSTRGLALWQSADGRQRRIILTVNNMLMAIDADTGETITSFGRDGKVDLKEGFRKPPSEIGRIYSATPGRIYKNLIILGSSPGESYGAAAGDVRAYNVVSGALAWTFHTIPQPGEYGYESWPKDAWQYAGGANVWGEMSLDMKRGVIYLPTGSATYDFYGANRVGNNLFANSIIALDAATGRRLWHFQTVHHDLWDYDNNQAPKLLTLKRGARNVDVVALAGKTGYLYVFDRVSGKPFFPIVERPVPASDVPGEMASPTQPVPLFPSPFAQQSFSAKDVNPRMPAVEREAILAILRTSRNEGIFTPPSLKGTISMPGNQGGGQFGNGAVDPKRQRLYVVGINQPTVIKLEDHEPTNYLRSAAIGGGADPTAARFASTCAACHGPTGRGQEPVFPRIAGIDKRMPIGEFIDIVKMGRRQMPPFPEFSNAELTLLYKWLSAPGNSPSAISAKGVSGPAKAPPAPAATEDEDDPHSQKSTASSEKRYFSAFNFLVSESLMLPASAPPWTTLTAYDMKKGAILWQKPLGGMPEAERIGLFDAGVGTQKSSIVATASGLLFSATMDAKLRAWDANTGKIVWQTDLPSGAATIPAVYSAGGRQFIVISASSPRGGSAGEKAYVAYALPKK